MSEYPYTTGDVFLFEPDDSCLSQLICALSDSPVSHAAVYCNEGRILEAGLPTVGSRTLEQLGKDRPIHVMGHREPDAVAAALLPVLLRQGASREPYSMGNLITVGLLLAGKSKLKKLPRAVLPLMRHICAEIARFIDAKKHPGRHPMTCSQFVYHCYLEAGRPLKLDANASQRDMAGSAILPESPLARVLESGCLPAGEAALREAPADAESDAGERALPSADEIMEKLCCVALHWMFSSKRNQDAGEEPMGAADEAEMTRQTAVFASLVLELDLDGVMSPPDMAARSTALERLNVVYEAFVSPGDLLLHCPDLAEKEVLNKNNLGEALCSEKSWLLRSTNTAAATPCEAASTTLRISMKPW